MAGQAMACDGPGGSAPETKGEEAEEDKELTTNPFWGFIWVEDDRRGRSTVEQSFKQLQWWLVVAGPIPAEEKLGWRLGKVEEVLGKVPTQGIEAWWPEGGDQREGRRERAQLGSV